MDTEGKVKLDIGGGRIQKAGFKNIDITQFMDGNGKPCVDIVMDVEREKLPFPDASVDEIHVDNVLEHLVELRFVLNECHRVLKEGATLKGCVPVAGSDVAWGDITHVRHFIKRSFDYFTGTNPAKPDRPGHPKYADYGFAPWNKVRVEQDGDLIFFELTPRKIKNPPYAV